MPSPSFLPSFVFVRPDSEKAALVPLTLTIEPTIDGTRIVGGIDRRLKPWTLTVSWAIRSSRFYETPVSRSDERPLMRTTVKDYGAAYRAACRAVEEIDSRDIQAAFRRALIPTPIQRLEVLGIYTDGEEVTYARALYRWRFVGNKGPGWDVEVDERYAKRYRGIACYLHDLKNWPHFAPRQPHPFEEPNLALTGAAFRFLGILSISMTLDEMRTLAVKVREKTATVQEEMAFYKAFYVLLQKTEILLSMHKSDQPV